jgi:hypothetical protein
VAATSLTWNNYIQRQRCSGLERFFIIEENMFVFKTKEHFCRTQQNLSLQHKIGWRPAKKFTVCYQHASPSIKISMLGLSTLIWKPRHAVTSSWAGGTWRRGPRKATDHLINVKKTLGIFLRVRVELKNFGRIGHSNNQFKPKTVRYTDMWFSFKFLTTFLSKHFCDFRKSVL